MKRTNYDACVGPVGSGWVRKRVNQNFVVKQLRVQFIVFGIEHRVTHSMSK